jgi:hypothetical protein
VETFERLEDAGVMLGGDAQPLVLDPEAQVGADRLAADRHPRDGARGDVLQRVVDQVGHALLEGDGVGQHGAERLVDADVGGAGFDATVRQHSPD